MWPNLQENFIFCAVLTIDTWTIPTLWPWKATLYMINNIIRSKCIFMEINILILLFSTKIYLLLIILSTIKLYAYLDMFKIALYMLSKKLIFLKHGELAVRRI